MRFGVMLGGFTGMVLGLQTMAMRDMGVVAGEMSLAFFMALGGLTMVLSGFLVMLGSGLMMFDRVQSAHCRSPLEGGYAAWRMCRGQMQAR